MKFSHFLQKYFNERGTYAHHKNEKIYENEKTLH